MLSLPPTYGKSVSDIIRHATGHKHRLRFAPNGAIFLCINTRYAADNNIRVVNDNENGNDNYSNYIHLCFKFLILM